MRQSESHIQFSVAKSITEKIGFNPYYHNMNSCLSDPIIINGEAFINLASNNYLGLASDKRVKDAIACAVDKYGASMCGTPIATGYTDTFKRLEERLSKFVGLEDTMIFPSCFQANTSLFSVIAEKDDLMIIDHYAHASLIQGVRTVGCKIKPFLHNNMGHLENILKASVRYRKIFVITESVFSTEGSIAPFDEILRLCDRYNAIAVIDDSHGIGVIGKNGRGILEEKSIKDFQGIYTASLGKSLANSGGIISGKKELIEYLRYYCPGYVYSTALTPAVIGGIDKVIDIIEQEFDLIARRMWEYKRLISDCFESSSLKLSKGEAPITSIITGSTEDTIKMSKILYENYILSTPFVHPSVPPEEGKVRLIAGANLRTDTMEKAIKILKKVSNS